MVKKSFIPVFVVLIVPLAAITQSLKSLLDLDYGEYEVGLKQEKIIYHNTIEILITSWYPAQKKNQQPTLTLEEFFLLDGIKKDRNFDSTISNIFCGNCNIEKAKLQKILQTRSSVQKNAIEVNKKFPAIIWSSRHGTAYYQSAFNEYLASHGFVVFCVSRYSPPLPLPWEVDSSARKDLFEKHQADLNTMIAAIKDDKNVDTTRLALFSWSYGGESAILTQQSHSEIDIVFGFSSINFKRPFFLTSEFDKTLKEEKLNVPYVLFYEDTSRFGRKITTDVLHPAHFKQSKLLQFPELIHGNFNYVEGYIPSSFDLTGSHPWVNRSNAAKKGYEAICRLTLLFLTSHLNKTNNDLMDDEIQKIRSEFTVNFIQTKK